MTSITSLPKTLECRDVVYGPKVSFVMVTEGGLLGKSAENVAEICSGIARDIFTFGQAGCNAPHNILLLEIKKTLKIFLRI